MKLKIISGGQTGVDQAALRAAKALGVATGGTMPLGWLTEDGPRPEFETLYGMVASLSSNYVARTERNVRDADATFWYGPTGSRGYLATRRAALKLGKPFVSAIAPSVITASELVTTARRVGSPTFVLNVAGSRESRAPGVGAEAVGGLTTLFQVLLDAISEEGEEQP